MGRTHLIIYGHQPYGAYDRPITHTVPATIVISFSPFLNLDSAACHAVSVLAVHPSVLVSVFLRQPLHCRAASSVPEPSCAAVLNAAPWPMCFCKCERERLLACARVCIYHCVRRHVRFQCAIVLPLRLCLIAMHQRPCQWCLLMGFRFNFYIIM